MAIHVNSVTAVENTLTAVNNNAKASGEKFNSYINQAATGYGDYLEQIFQKAADTYQVSKDLLKAMAKAESNFDKNATSRCGAMGIMQLMPATAASLGVSDAYDPEQNIMGGAQYISRLLQKYNGNVSYAVAAYNAGSGNVDKYGGIPPFSETQNYVAKILQYLEEGVTIPGSATVGTPSADATQVSRTGNVLQETLNKYFDYDDYLEFLQLFTKVIYEKLAGKELLPETADASEKAEENAPAQEETQTVEPAKILTMRIEDAEGRILTYQQDASSGGDAQQAYQYMTAGGQNRMAVILNKGSNTL